MGLICDMNPTAEIALEGVKIGAPKRLRCRMAPADRVQPRGGAGGGGASGAGGRDIGQVERLQRRQSGGAVR